jgi:hypothetical protein
MPAAAQALQEPQLEFAENQPLPTVGEAELISAAEVAGRLGVTISTVHLRAKTGFLHPVMIKHKLMFHPHEVDAELNRVQQLKAKKPGVIPTRQAKPLLPAPVQGKDGALRPPEPHLKPTDSVQVGNLIYNGQQCANAVKLFREGKQPLDAVVDMELTFEIAKHFWKEFLALQPVWVLPQKQFAQLRTLYGWEEDPPTPEGMMKAVRAFIDKEVDRETKAGIARELGQEVSEEEKVALAQLDAELAAEKARKDALKAKATEKTDGK